MTGNPIAPKTTPIMRAPRNHQSEPYGSSPVSVGRNPVLVQAIAEM